jgi:hypothetical protein
MKPSTARGGPTITIRMGAAHWDARIHQGSDEMRFDFRTMDRKERSAFHRELMNAFRQMQQAA